MRATISTVGVILAVSLMVFGAFAGTATAESDAEHDVSIELPENMQTGEEEIEVEIENEADEDLFAPIIEIPLGSSFAVPDPDPSAAYDDTTLEERPYEVLESSYDDGESLYIYGNEVPAETTKTYTFTIDIERTGSFTLESDVRPMYDEPRNDRDTVTATAGSNELTVLVEDEAGSLVEDATVVVDGAERDGGLVSMDVSDGTYEVGAIDNGEELPSIAADVETEPEVTVTFVSHESVDSFGDPQVIATSGDGSISSTSIEGEVTQMGTAETVTEHHVSFEVETTGGTTVLGGTPASFMPQAFANVSATIEGAATETEVEDGVVLLELEESGTSEIVYEFEGYRLGDATSDGTVKEDDARHVASTVASGEDTNSYGDVTQSGELSAVDAMKIAQYAADNRDDEFEREEQ